LLIRNVGEVLGASMCEGRERGIGGLRNTYSDRELWVIFQNKILDMIEVEMIGNLGLNE